MGDPDYLMALELQKQFAEEIEDDSDVELKDYKYDKKEVQAFKKQKWAANYKNDLDNTFNLVHPEWETLDPTPDVFALFSAFDDKFFQGKLKCVTLEWSKRMYSCAGICYSRRNALGMAITIRLSEPLLKLRSRKDLVETLLHEMIHAYLSVLKIREGNGGHGPNFKKIMHTINKVAGTNITVYHTFHDEVDLYKTHWWRCNGICQNRKPFFGFVKRTSNRAPGPNDIWWRQHLESCGGSFLKVREPEKNIKSNKEKIKKEPKKADIRKFFGDKKPIPKTFTPGAKTNGGGTLVINSKTNTVKTNDLPKGNNTVAPPKKSGGNLTNVIGFKDLTSPPPNTAKRSNNTFSDSEGHCLGSTTKSSNIVVIDDDKSTNIEREKVRKAWANRFIQSISSDREESQSKKPRIENEGAGSIESIEPIATSSPINNQQNWVAVDDEVMFKEEVVSVVDISSDEDEVDVQAPSSSNDRSKSLKDCSPHERQEFIKKEIMDSSENSDDEIEILDDDYDDNCVSGVVEIADTSLIDDLFGEDTLIKEFKRENGLYARNSNYLKDKKNDIVNCPVCQEKITREVFSDHLDGCTGIIKKIQVLPSTSRFKSAPSNATKNSKKVKSDIKKEIIPNAMRDSSPSRNLDASSSDDNESEYANRRNGLLDTSQHACPVCAQYVDVNKINEHLDTCLRDSNN